MGYGFKYSTSDIDNTLRKGNATTTAGHASNPSDNFHSGIAVVSGKHTVAKVFSSDDPDYWSLDDNDLVRLCNSLGANIYTPLEAINYILNQSDLFYIDNSVYDNSVLDNVAVNLQGDYDSSFVNNEPTTNLIAANGLDFTQMSTYGNLSRAQVTDGNSSSGYACEMEILDGEAINSAARVRFGSDFTIPSSGNAAISVYVKFEGGTFSNIQPAMYNGTGTAWQYLLPLDGGSNYLTTEYRRFGLYTALTANPGFSMTKSNSNKQTGQITRWHSPQVEDSTLLTGFTSGTRSQNTNWVDLSGNSNDASLTNTPTFEKESKALNFDGEDQYATIDSDDAFTVNTRTVEMTFKMNGTYANFAPLATYANGSSTSNRIWLGLQNSKWQMHGWGTTDPNATTTIIADGWYTCVFSYNGNAVQQMKLYTNGKLESTTTNTQGGVVGVNGNNWYLATIPGGWQSQTYSAMSINSFKIYSRILTDDEVESNFFGGPILTDNLVFNADAGNLTSYESGSSTAYSTQDAIDGTLNNGVDFTFENGGSWVFDGTDDYINFGSDSPIDFIYSDPFSLEVWLNADNTSGFKHLIGKSYADYRLAQNGAGISFRLDSNNLTTQFGTIVAGEWTHIVATWEPSTSTAYVYQDGVLKGSLTDATVDWTDTGNNFQIGTSPGEAYYVQGKIPIGRAYSKTLSLLEVQQNYNALKSRFPS